VKFLALVIAMGLLQYWGSAGPVHRDDWFRDLVRRFSGSGLMLPLQLAMSVLLPALLVLWLLDFVQGWALGLVPLAISVLVLLYSFGRGDFEALLEQYREYCRNSDVEAAFLFAQQKLDRGGSGECPSSPEKLHRWIKDRFCYLGFERWFSVMFYFVLLGAPGALAYRLLSLYREQWYREGLDSESSEEAGHRRLLNSVQYLADWLPARLLVFTFSITGDWVGSREQLSASLTDTGSPTAELLGDAAHASLGLKATVFASDSGDNGAFAEVSDWEMGQLQGLLSRSAVAWVVVLALLVLLI
jgi:AmpE protein